MTDLEVFCASTLGEYSVLGHKKNIYLEDAEIVEAIKKVEAKLEGAGRVLIRPSGTEPLVRVMLEGENQEEIDEMAHGLAKLIEEKYQ